MPGTVTGVAFGAATGGAIGGLLAGADYGVMLGAVIGASVSVIASKENNRRKIAHFFLALGAGMLIAFPASELISQVWQLDVSPKITAIGISALLIPVLVLAASRENLEKGGRRLFGLIEKQFSTIVDAIKNIRGKGGQ